MSKNRLRFVNAGRNQKKTLGILLRLIGRPPQPPPSPRTRRRSRPCTCTAAPALPPARHPKCTPTSCTGSRFLCRPRRQRSRCSRCRRRRACLSASRRRRGRTCLPRFELFDVVAGSCYGNEGGSIAAAGAPERSSRLASSMRARESEKVKFSAEFFCSLPPLSPPTF